MKEEKITMFKSKRILSIFLVLCAIVNCVSLTAFAGKIEETKFSDNSDLGVTVEAVFESDVEVYEKERILETLCERAKSTSFHNPVGAFR